MNDADFGVMRLVRQWGAGKRVGEQEWRESAMLSWEAKVGGIEIGLSAERADETPEISAAVRAAIKHILEDDAASRLAVSENIIALAQEWKASSGDGPPPTIASFAAGIRIQTISVDFGENVKVWLEEIEQDPHRSVFHGHGLLAHLHADGTVGEVDIVG